MDIKEQIIKDVASSIKQATGLENFPAYKIEQPKDQIHGDYSSNIALAIFSNSKFKIQNSKFRTPMELAQEIVKILNTKYLIQNTGRAEAVAPGFINVWLSYEQIINQVSQLIKGKKIARSGKSNKKIFVEYAHPNTHKEMHIGHMRTLITGEAIVRLFEATGATVFRANYQGDIGPHVAKALYGVEKLLKDRSLTLDQVEKWSHKDKAHFLGEAYVVGNQDYEAHKEEIDSINDKLYKKAGGIEDLYQQTRQWSLDYYKEFYTRFYTTFDRLFFESEMVDSGKQIVLDNIGKVFMEDEGAIIFPGEKYGLHRRVFITKAGYPTYEGKEMGNGFTEYQAFPFDQKIHVVASEQTGYFKVVFKALELLDPKKFKNKQHHISMGMVHLSDRKMSSRTGDILTVDWLIDQVREGVNRLMEEGRIAAEDKEKVIEQITIGAIKYSVLKVGTGQDVAFDIEKSISLEGDSGPYLQYTYARTQSVARKSQILNPRLQLPSQSDGGQAKFQIHAQYNLDPEELSLLRTLYHFPDVVEKAAFGMAPNIVATYLFDVAQKFNLFYQKHKILESEKKEFRLGLTAAVGQVIKEGFYLLGIQAPERM